MSRYRYVGDHLIIIIAVSSSKCATFSSRFSASAVGYLFDAKTIFTCVKETSAKREKSNLAHR